jgi:hypothetical protein
VSDWTGSTYGVPSSARLSHPTTVIRSPARQTAFFTSKTRRSASRKLSPSGRIVFGRVSPSRAWRTSIRTVLLESFTSRRYRLQVPFVPPQERRNGVSSRPETRTRVPAFRVRSWAKVEATDVSFGAAARTMVSGLRVWPSGFHQPVTTTWSPERRIDPSSAITSRSASTNPEPIPAIVFGPVPFPTASDTYLPGSSGSTSSRKQASPRQKTDPPVRTHPRTCTCSTSAPSAGRSATAVFTGGGTGVGAGEGVSRSVAEGTSVAPPLPGGGSKASPQADASSAVARASTAIRLMTSAPPGQSAGVGWL